MGPHAGSPRRLAACGGRLGLARGRRPSPADQDNDRGQEKGDPGGGEPHCPFQAPGLSPIDPADWSLVQARVVISDWKADYNHRRRHSALGYQAPAVYAGAWNQSVV
jgi:transposase InsO family protein